MSAEIRSITGEKLQGVMPKVTPLSILKDLVTDIEAGKVAPYQVVILLATDSGCGDCDYSTRTNDLSTSEVITRLAIEQYLAARKVFPNH